MKKEKSSFLGIHILFGAAAAMVLFFALFNWINYKNAVKSQEELVSRKQQGKLDVYANVFSDRIENSVKVVNFIKDEVLSKYISGEKSKDETEDLFRFYLKSEGDFGAAYILYDEKKIVLEASYDIAATKAAETALETGSAYVNNEIYFSPFYLKNGREYMTVSVKIDSRYTLTAVYDLEYFSGNYLRMNNSDYREFFMLDKSGYIIYSYERNKIGKNVFELSKNNQPVFDAVTKYISLKNGRDKLKIVENGKMIKIFISWQQLEVGDEKIIVCSSTPYEEIEGVIKNLTSQFLYFSGLIILLFSSFVLFYIRYLKNLHNELVNEKIKDEKEKLELVLSGTNSFYWESYPEQFEMEISDSFYSELGITKEELINCGEAVFECIDQERHGDFKKIVSRNVNTGADSFNFECRVKSLSKDERWFLSRTKVIRDKNDKLIKVIGIIYEITEGKKQEKRLKFFEMAVQHSSATIVMTDLKGTINYVNNKFELLTGYTKEEALGENPRILKSGLHNREFYKNLWNTIKSGASWYGEFINRRKDGSIYYERAIISSIIGEDKKMIGYMAIKEDITKQKDLEKKLEKYATKDELTGVYNRRVSFEFLEQQLKSSDRNKINFSIIFVDVNNLKRVNDTLGHNYGDSLIRDVCSIISGEVRESDIMARLGGDEFLVILPNCKAEEAEEIWERIVRKAEEINCINGREYRISASHGIYEYITGSGITADEIIEEADRRMYSEKKIIKAREEAAEGLCILR